MNRRAIVTLVIIVAVLGVVWALTSYQRARKTQDLLTKLALPDEAKAMEAMEQLRHRGRSLAPRLIEHLSSQQPRVRWRAAVLVGEIGTGNRQVLDKLVALCSDKDAAVRKAAMIACGRLKLTEAAGTIIQTLSDTSAAPDVRATAAMAAGMLQAKEAVKALAALLKEHPPVKVEEQQEGEETKAEAEQADEQQAEETAEEEEPDELWQARMEAAWALGQIATSEAVDALAEAVKDEVEPNVSVRTAAAHALADAANAPEAHAARLKAVRAMLDAMGDEAGDVRIAAAMSLARTYPPDSVRPEVERTLRQHIDDEHYWVREAVRYAMKQLRVAAEG